MRVLVAGGAGFIGSITGRLFSAAGHKVAVFDNLSTGHRHNLQKTPLIIGDLRNPEQVEAVFQDHKFDLVLNFAAKIQVEESIGSPKDYIENNVFGTLNLIDAAVRAGVKNFIFSSTAAVYGQPKTLPISEDAPKAPINPYGLGKYLVEQVLYSYQKTHSLGWLALRYFNAAGAYNGIGPDYPFITHLIPQAIESALAKNELKVFGGDYPTPDGTCVRDFVHVKDIARAHLLAAEKMTQNQAFNQAINLGSGQGYSILEVIKTLEKSLGYPVNYQIKARRPGDPAELVASNTLAKTTLGWQPEADLAEIIQDALDWRLAKAKP